MFVLLSTLSALSVSLTRGQRSSQGPTPRNDFCRIFNHEGLLEPLSSALLSVSKDDDDLAESAKAKIINIFLLFAQSDRKVKEAMANRVVVLRECLVFA